MEQQEEIQEAMEEFRLIKREFQELAKSKGWDRLRKYAEAQLGQRRTERENMSGSLDVMIASEYLNGEISGIRLFMSFPEILISDFDEQLEELKEVLKDDS